MCLRGDDMNIYFNIFMIMFVIIYIGVTFYMCFIYGRYKGRHKRLMITNIVDTLEKHEKRIRKLERK